MSKLFLRVALVVFLAMGFCENASAALFNGKTVEYQYFFADLSSPYSSADNGNKVVGPGIEVNPVVDSYGTMDISDTNMLIQFPDGIGLANGTFNGFRLTDINGTIPDFSSVTINLLTNASGFTSSNITFDADHIWVNWRNLSFAQGTVVSLDVNGNSQVPEPTTVLLLGLGLMGLAGIRRIRRIFQN